MLHHSRVTKYIAHITLILLLFMLSGCGGDSVCYEADDFGFTNFNVSARYDKNEMSGQEGEEQVAPWRNSNYRVNGRPLVIVVKGWQQGVDANIPSELSAWCPWYGKTRHKRILSGFCERLRECQFIDDQMCTNTQDAQITNAPCIFTKGVGLYALIAGKETDPNTSFASQKSPEGITFHLGEVRSGYEMTDLDRSGNARSAGGIIYKYEDNETLKQEYASSELYFKILDKFYDDNSGKYRVSIKSGISTNNPDPITVVTNLIKTYLFGLDGDDYGLIRNLYTGIVENSNYQMAVTGMLTLFIIWSALSYLSGNIAINNTEIVVRVFKVAIISVLVNSQYSWNFFYDYLFVWFVGGVEQIIQMITEAGATGPGAPGILSMMMAPQTTAKLLSLLFVDWMGFIYIILFFLALYFIVLVYFDASVIYLTALMAVGMIIVMGPIFLCFMLFGITRSLFENWLRQLISYAIQPIILFTGIVFISMILRQEIYGALGFQVCKQGIFQANREVLSANTREELGFDIGNTLFYWWFPMPMRGENFTRNKQNIPVPIDHFVTEDNIVTDVQQGTFCEAYGCIEARYPDLPFLDPVKDQRRIQQFWNGKFVQLDGLLLIFVAIYLLDKFNGTALSMARFISGSSGNLTDISSVSRGVGSGVRSNINKLGAAAQRRFAKTTVGRRAIQLREDVSEKIKNIKEAPSKWIDERKITKLEREAISSKPNQIIVDEVKKLSGLDHQDLKKGAIASYTRALKLNLKEIDPNLSDKQLNEIAGSMSYKKSSQLKKEFARAKYGKEFAKLNDNQRESIAKIVEGKYQAKSLNNLAEEKYGKKYQKLTENQKVNIERVAKSEENKLSLRELAINAEFSRKYAESYIDAYQALSERGVGLMGKSSYVFKSLAELNHQNKQRQEMAKIKEQQRGENLYAGYQNLKHRAFEKIAGNSDNELVKAIGNNFAGGAWHNINMNRDAKNYRRQNYNEQLLEQAKEQEYQKISEEIARLSKSQGENITSPEFILRAKERGDANIAKYEQLARRELEQKVYQQLSSGEEPVLRGNKFMSKYAKDSEMARMIDRAEEIKENLLAQDPFFAKEERYELALEKAENELVATRDKLENYYQTKISAQDLGKMLDQYNEDQQLDAARKSLEQAKLNKSLKNFASNQAVLKEINTRKLAISNEVDKHIAKINDYREKAGMNQYQSSNRKQTANRLERTIDDLGRK